MGIIGIKRIIYEYRDHNNWRDYPREREDLPILKIEKRNLSLIL